MSGRSAEWLRACRVMSRFARGPALLTSHYGRRCPFKCLCMHFGPALQSFNECLLSLLVGKRLGSDLSATTTLLPMGVDYVKILPYTTSVCQSWRIPHTAMCRYGMMWLAARNHTAKLADCGCSRHFRVCGWLKQCRISANIFHHLHETYAKCLVPTVLCVIGAFTGTMLEIIGEGHVFQQNLRSFFLEVAHA